MPLIPFFCGNKKCSKVVDELDYEYMLKYGICAFCYYKYIENRREEFSKEAALEFVNSTPE